MLRNIINKYTNSNSLVKNNNKVKAVVLDWSGTTIDKYVIAPTKVFTQVFENQNVPITMSEARIPMGLRKDIHIKTILEMPQVKERWYKEKGR